jgi:tripartite-type tricarboxylate transporter receptor subunit TctC
LAPAASAAPKAPSSKADETGLNEQAVANFYGGKTIHIVVGFAAGGGYDTYARLISRHLGKFVPGNPAVIVDNMPGAGSLLALNHVNNTGPKDGTEVGSVSGGLFLQALFGNQSVRFDATTMQYLGVPNATFNVLLVHKRAGITKFDEILGPNGKQLVLGGEAPGISTHDGAVLLREVLGANIKLVAGYQGTAPIRQALEGGEIDGFVNSMDSLKLTMLEQIKSGEILALAQWRDEPTPELLNPPSVYSFATMDEQRQLLRYGLAIPQIVGRPYVLAPEVPQDRVRALQAAFTQTLSDREFLAEAEKAQLDIDVLDGAETRRLVTDLFGMPPNIKTRLQQLIGG